MARKSTLLKLPKDLLGQIDGLLVDGRLTIKEIRDFIASKVGEENTPSSSALGRRAVNAKKVAAKLREGREIANSIMQDLGPGVTESKQGRLLVEAVRNLAFNQIWPLVQSGGTDIKTEDFFLLSRAIKDLAMAQRYDQDFEMKLKAAAQKEAEAKMEKAMRDVAKTGGVEALTPQQVLERVKAVYRGEA